jgi:hypothetical protein
MDFGDRASVLALAGGGIVIAMRFSVVTLRLSCGLSLIGVTGCHSKSAPSPTESETVSADPRVANSADHRRFGGPISPGAAVALSSVIDKPDDFQNQSVVVEAKVRRNCTRRGCWMELAESLGNDTPGCRVTFKDYSFFVPLDSAGSNARVQGSVQVRLVPEQEVAHLESEGAKFTSKQADGTAREVRMIATGVELWRGPS